MVDHRSRGERLSAQFSQREVLDAFEAWLDAPPSTRDGDLASLWHGRPELMREIRRLISAHHRGAMLPTEPPIPLEAAEAGPPPARVGVYRLIEPIGDGGMGTVFRAERDDGIFQQTVAVKLIRRTLFSRAAAAQFASERQILARLRHPHIAQLLDGGVTPEGESYIVMELLEGAAITDYSTKGGLSLRQRVELVRHVCEAVQAAHQQLIVHADIKPSNVIVDERYGVKLLDFGIGRIIDADPDDRPRARAHTPAFASPQQAAGLSATPADDVFALGRLLGVLSEDHPTSSQLTAVIARATSPEPGNRYGAASALADDLDRWLRGRPVAAAPPSRRRSAGMFARRHRLALGATMLAIAALAAAAGISTTLYLRAEAARRQSDARFAQVRQLSKYLLTDVTTELQRFPGASRLRRELADRGRAYLESLSKLPGAPLDVRLEVAQGYATTAEILGRPSVQSLGDPRAAERDLARAERDLTRLEAETGGRADVELGLARTLTTHAAIAQITENDPHLGERLFQRACGLAERVAAAAPHDAAASMAHIQCSLGLAALLNYEARFSEMERPLDVAFGELSRRAPGMDDAARALAVGNALMLRGDARYYLGDKVRPLIDYRAAAAALEPPRDRAPDVRLLERQAWADYEVSSLLEDEGRAAPALPVVGRGVAVADLALRLEPSPRARHVSAVLHMQRGVNLAALHRFPAAIDEGERALRAYRVAARLAPDDFEALRSVPVGLRPLGQIYWAAGRRVRACAIFAEDASAWRDLARGRGVTGFDTTSELLIVKKLLAGCRPTR